MPFLTFFNHCCPPKFLPRNRDSPLSDTTNLSHFAVAVIDVVVQYGRFHDAIWALLRCNINAFTMQYGRYYNAISTLLQFMTPHIHLLTPKS